MTRHWHSAELAERIAAMAKPQPHPEVLAFASALARRPSAEVAAAFVVDMIEDAKEGLLRR